MSAIGGAPEAADTLPAHLAAVVGDAKVYPLSEVYNGILQRMAGWGTPWISAEITDLKPRDAGAIAFSLCDERARIDAFMSGAAVRALGFSVSDGLGVLCKVRFGVYAQGSKLQVRILELVPRDTGPRQLAYEQARARLTADGLLDRARKRPLPRYPTRVGIVTSRRGKAIDDILAVLGRRRPDLEVSIWSVSVQGSDAAVDIVAAIDGFTRLLPDTDVLLIGRGGGSADDLWVWNDERIARAIGRSTIPTVACVGHTADRSLAGLVADRDAETPSVAAELITPIERTAMDAKLDELTVRAADALQRRSVALRTRVELLGHRAVFTDPTALTEDLDRRLGQAGDTLDRAAEHHVAAARERFDLVRVRTHAASPLGALERGFAVAQRASDGVIVRAPGDVAAGDRLRLRVHGGDIDCEVT